MRTFNRRKLLGRLILLPVGPLLAAGCANPQKQAAMRAKIQFDLEALNEDGLIGPPDGLRAVDYEFCIPANPEYLTEVQLIDPSVVMMRDSQGRVGCAPDEWLCLGNTHQTDAQGVLLRLAQLPYVYVIRPCFWE